MLRIRLFRILLPVILIGVVVLLIWAIQPPPDVDTNRPPVGPLTRGADGAELRIFGLGPGKELRETLVLAAERFEECAEVSIDCVRAINVERFKLAREEQDDLEVTAATAVVSGEEGQRQMRFEGPMHVEDKELGLLIDLPYLNVDEFTGVGRSQGAINIEGSGHHTRAERLIYGLAGQATELFRIEMKAGDGGLLLAERAFLHDSVYDVELVQGVHFREEDDDRRFRAERCRVRRDKETGQTRDVVAEGNVVVTHRTVDGFLEAAGDLLNAAWDEAGEIASLSIDGRALLELGAQFVSADLLALEALPDGQGWSVDARGSVRAAGEFEGGTARVRADNISAVLDAERDLVEAEAGGSVRFESPGTAADAAVARVRRLGDSADELEIELLAGRDLRARLAQGDSRVTADRILTDTGGSALAATGRVESTLLPAGGEGAPDGLFSTDKAVHFISAELHGSQSGNELVFSGNVRGWQGDQNLSAQRVRLNSETGRLRAEDRVSTRFPRVTDVGAATDDFVQVAAESLDYDRDARRGVYEGAVRIEVAEGWIESDKLTVTQHPDDGEFRSLVAEGHVRLEFRESTDDEGAPLPRTTGLADRLVYTPAEQTIQLFGDEQPAEVQRGGDQAGVSRGRVLTYRLDDGSLSVEGGTVKAPAPVDREQPE